MIQKRDYNHLKHKQIKNHIITMRQNHNAKFLLRKLGIVTLSLVPESELINAADGVYSRVLVWAGWIDSIIGYRRRRWIDSGS